MKAFWRTFVILLFLTPPSSGSEFRSTVWIGAVPEVLKSGSALRPDFNPRLLSLDHEGASDLATGIVTSLPSLNSN